MTKISQSLVLRVVALAGSLALLGGGAAIMASSAGAATNACGTSCIDISFLSSGHHWLLNDSKGSEVDNATVSQQQGSNGGAQGRNEDFEAYGVGTVDTYYCPGGIDPVFTANQCAALDNAGLGGATAYEVEYYPYGGDGSGLCISAWDGQDPVPSGYKARFQPCGQNADSIMIVTTNLDHGAFHTSGGFWVVSGGSDNFSHPVVLTNNGQQQWQNLTWQTVETDGSGGVVNQEVQVTPGPYV